MVTRPNTTHEEHSRPKRAGLEWLGRARDLGATDLAVAALRTLASRLRHGQIVLVLPDGRRIEAVGTQPGPHAYIHIHHPSAVRQLVFGGDVAFAEAYMRGDWSSPDLAAVIEVAALNRDAILRALEGFAPARLFNWVTHRLRGNSKAGSRRNIAAHYDLGNEFYAQWLDARMLYSSAIYRGQDASLEDAQMAKVERVVQLVDAKPDHRVLEIGVGWGAVAREIAQTTGAHVTGLTLSKEQLAHVTELASREALAERIEARFEDYRDTRGVFDRIVSVEMIEAVGREYWPTYFQVLRERLASGGHAIVQAITIEHARLAKYAATPDFMQLYIFPGGMLPSTEVMATEAARAGLTFECIENFGASYARTLAAWRERFIGNWQTIEALGFDEVFRRKWEYYLSYCEGGFRAGSIDVGLYRLRPTS